MAAPQVGSAGDKTLVRDFWQESSCGEVYARGIDVAAQLEAHSRSRYALEPYLPPFARFESGAGKDVLEVGVGMGADHAEWARHGPRSLCGIDLTQRGVEWTAERLRLAGHPVRVGVGDAEQLPFPDESFDLVFSWGVLHHTPDPARAIGEVHRVLRPGGEARIMLYHAHSIVGYLLWLRYALLAGRPRRSLREVYDAHLESPGTQAFTIQEARELLSPFAQVRIEVQLSFADLLEGEVGQRHEGGLLAAAKRLWPRRLIERFGRRRGLYLMIDAAKASPGMREPVAVAMSTRGRTV